jgi:predicted GIY-YIG superfamily endonuclease
MSKTQEYILYKNGKIYARITDPLQAQIVAHNQKASVYFTYNNHETFISSYE